jgi:hypothetical protein
MSNLSELLPSGGGGAKEATFTATGTLASGQTVGLRSDGTVEPIAETNVGASTTTPVTTMSSPTYSSQFVAEYDAANNRIFIATGNYSSIYITTGVINTSTGAITFNSTVASFTHNGNYYDISYDPNKDELFIVYTTSITYFAIGTLSGSGTSTTISLQTGLGGIYSGSANNVSVGYDDHSNCHWVWWKDGGSAWNYYSAIAAIKTTSSSAYSQVTQNYFYAYYQSSGDPCRAVRDNNGRLWWNIIFHDGSHRKLLTKCFTLSGSTMTDHGNNWYDPAPTNYLESYSTIAYDSTNNQLLCMAIDNNSGNYYDYGIIYNIATTTLSQDGTFSQVFNVRPRGEGSISMVYDSTEDCYVYSVHANTPDSIFIYKASYDQSTNALTATYQTSVSTADYFILQGSECLSWYDSASKYVGHVMRSTNNVNQQSFTFRLAHTTTNNDTFIGITNEAIANAATGTVTLKGGVPTNLTGLTIDSDMYLQGDGTISTTSTSPAINIGKAFSTTAMILKGVS